MALGCDRKEMYDFILATVYFSAGIKEILSVILAVVYCNNRINVKIDVILMLWFTLVRASRK